MGKTLKVKPLGFLWWLFLAYWALPLAAVLFSLYDERLWAICLALFAARWLQDGIEVLILDAAKAAAERALGVEEQ